MLMKDPTNLFVLATALASAITLGVIAAMCLIIFIHPRPATQPKDGKVH